MLYSSKTKKNADLHHDGHPFGRRQKKQSQGNNNRKQGSLQRSKPRRGQGK
jgi:hypothetical protein